MPNRLHRVQELFEQASGLQLAERRSFLQTACGDDETLITEVEELLRHDSESGDSLVAALGQEANEAFSAHPIRERIGPYRIIRELGRGGMGTVYLAMRDDDEYRKEVAIKIVPAVVDRDELMRRFKAERQIMASLEHPNIAHMLDGDTTDDGLPYVVMEYVNGQPIDEYCDGKQLSTTACLELFRQVCAAVSHAHRNLIIHRDIKPGNILVTEDGTPKLLDFGIAKILDTGDTPYAGSVTKSSMRLMTPEYASPEQARGQPVNTASDIYSLGVLLHKLLSGGLPYSLDTRELGAIERIICEQPPTRPSALRSSVDSELDDIVMMALRKEPERRYGSVEQFSEDIRRYLVGLPVTARADTLSYRFNKFLQRHRTGVAVSSAVVVGFAVLVAFYTTQLATERDIARAEADKSQRVAELLEEILQAAGPEVSQGEELTAERLLSHGTDRVRDELKNEPALLADMLEVIGRTYRTLGKFDEAYELTVESLELRENTLPANDVLIGDSLFQIGFAEIELGDLEAAFASLQRALQVYEANFGNEPNTKVAVTLRELSYVYDQRAEYAKAEEAILRSLEQLRVLYPDGSEELAASLQILLFTHMRAGRLEDVIATGLETIEMQRRVLGDVHPQLAASIYNTAYAYRQYGDLAKAEELLLEAIDMRTRLHGADSILLLTSTMLHARILIDRGDMAGAEAAAREAHRLHLKKGPATHRRATATTDMVMRALLAQGKFEEALVLGQQTLDTFNVLLEKPSPFLTMLHDQMVLAYLQAGDAQNAKRHLEEAQAQVHDPGEGVRPWAQFREADIDALNGNIKDAIRVYESALEDELDELDPSIKGNSATLMELGRLHEKDGNRSTALDYYQRAAEIYERTQVAQSPRLVEVRAALVRLGNEEER